MVPGYDGAVNAFRVLALAYALSALLIAPSWLSADELPAEEVAPAAQEAAPAPAGEEAGEVAPAPEPAAPAQEEAPVAVVQEAEEESVEKEEPVAELAQAEDEEPVAKAAADGSVTISDFKFSPKTVTVNEGDSVTFTNDGPTVHTATAEDGSFDTGNLNAGDSDTVTFDSAGTIAYICTPHPFMKGTVVVQAASSGGGSGGGGSFSNDSDGPTATTADDSASDSGDDLPATGFETLAIALLGMATLGAGLILRRRDQARD